MVLTKIKIRKKQLPTYIEKLCPACGKTRTIQKTSTRRATNLCKKCWARYYPPRSKTKSILIVEGKARFEILVEYYVICSLLNGKCFKCKNYFTCISHWDMTVCTNSMEFSWVTESFIQREIIYIRELGGF